MRPTLIFCAALLLSAAELPAADWIWHRYAEYRINIPADWTISDPASVKVSSGMLPLFSFKPRSGAFSLTLAYEESGEPDISAAERHFARLRKSSAAAVKRLELPDNSVFDYISSSAADAGARTYYVQGLLFKYLERYAVTFVSRSGFPAGRDWDDALKAFTSLEPDPPDLDSWRSEYRRKTEGAGAKRTAQEQMAALRNSTTGHPDGTLLDFDDVVIFSCLNLPGNRYLLNKDRTDQCRINSLEDYHRLAGKMAVKYYGKNSVFIEECPEEMLQEKTCDPAKGRNF